MAKSEYEIHPLAQVEEDNPVPHLYRKKVSGDQALIAQIRLEKGCVVHPHSHPSEQISYCVSGKCKWTLGPNGDEHIVDGGTIMVFPGGVTHGVVALEDSLMIDVISPPAAMGVDRQKT
jgi:quercetin dioxygenase-like cupin family protein